MVRSNKYILRYKSGGAGRRRTRSSTKVLSRLERRLRRERLKNIDYRKRCPKGMRRNKQTSLCELTQTQSMTQSKKATTRSKRTAVRSKRATTRSKRATTRSKRATTRSKRATVKKTILQPQTLFGSLMQRLGGPGVSDAQIRSKQSWEYSPTVNKVLRSLKTRSPDAQVFACGEKEISIATRKGRKCVHWESNEAQRAMLRNLNSKKPIVCNNIIAPKQLRGNCWFNTFFMCCFISDKGRKFFRFLRQTMITGVLPDGKAISKKLTWPLFLMNKCIDASLRGENDTTRYAWLMDTNLIIKNVYKALTPAQIKRYDIPKVGDAGHPLLFYAGLIQLLTGKAPDARRSILSIQEFSNVHHTHIESRLSWFFKTLPSIIAYELDDDTSKSDKIKRPLKLHFQHRGKSVTYVLDSAMLRDVSKKHFTAYITCGGNDYSFDGASFSRLEPFPWREKLNRVR